MEHLLFAGYLILFAWLVTRFRFLKRSGLTPPQLIIVFLLKVIAGIFYGWIGVYYGQLGQMQDTWMYHYESLNEYELLKTDAPEFFSSIFRNTYEDGYAKFFSTENSWWNDLKGTFFVKLLAIFNLASFGHYYVNVIFYSVITLFGTVALFKIMQDVFPKHRLTVLLATILLPSFIYWTSGLHKDGLIFLGLAMMAYAFYFGLKENKFSLRRALMFAAGFVMVLALRNFLVVTIVPAFAAWLLAQKLKYRPSLVFAAVYAVFVLLFFTARFIHPRLNLPEAVAVKQSEFLKLKGGSTVPVTKLEGSFSGFLKNTPESFSLSVLRPYPSDVKHLLSLAAATETNILLLFFVVFLFLRRKNGHRLSPFLLFCIFFSFSVLLMIGYSVNVLGAVVRYRSIVLPFLVVPMIAKIDWERIYQLFAGNIEKKNNI